MHFRDIKLVLQYLEITSSKITPALHEGCYIFSRIHPSTISSGKYWNNSVLIIPHFASNSVDFLPAFFFHFSLSAFMLSNYYYFSYKTASAYFPENVLLNIASSTHSSMLIIFLFFFFFFKQN
jgi:hypothetical protein